LKTHRAVNALRISYKNHLVNADRSEIHKNRRNAICGQNVHLLIKQADLECLNYIINHTADKTLLIRFVKKYVLICYEKCEIIRDIEPFENSARPSVNYICYSQINLLPFQGYTS
jgi:hypothetical protein